MIGKKTSFSETKHNIRLLIISIFLVIALTLFFFIISAVTGTGVKKQSKSKQEKVEQTYDTEPEIVIFNPGQATEATGEQIPTV